MIFEALFDSLKRNELILIDNGFCHWHLRKNGQITIREIFSNKRGVGTVMLEQLKKTPNANSIVAKCPEHLESNKWYEKRGFTKIRVEVNKKGNKINVWKLNLI